MRELIEQIRLEEADWKQKVAAGALALGLATGAPNVAQAATHHHHKHHQQHHSIYKVGHVFTGEASTYGWGEKLNPKTADGSNFDGNQFFVAMEVVPLGTIVTVKDLKTGKQHDFPVKDFGPGKRTHRIIDLSKGAWKQLGYHKPGLIKVSVTIKQLGQGSFYQGKW